MISTVNNNSTVEAVINPFDRLPNELLMAVLHYLPVEAWENLAETSKRLKAFTINLLKFNHLKEARIWTRTIAGALRAPIELDPELFSRASTIKAIEKESTLHKERVLHSFLQQTPSKELEKLSTLINVACEENLHTLALDAAKKTEDNDCIEQLTWRLETDGNFAVAQEAIKHHSDPAVRDEVSARLKEKVRKKELQRLFRAIAGLMPGEKLRDTFVFLEKIHTMLICIVLFSILSNVIFNCLYAVT